MCGAGCTRPTNARFKNEILETSVKKMMKKILKLSTAILMAALAFATVPANAESNVAPRLSLQLWSIKDDVHKDFEKTLTTVAAMGFQGVEFAGDFGPYANDPKGLKAFLQRVGLQASGAHVAAKLLNAENFAATVQFYQELGCTKLVVPNDARAIRADSVKDFAKELTTLSQQLKPYGMQIGFHNHSGEMAEFEGKTFWDVIAQNTPQEVILQQDAGWTSYAGKDPVYFVQRYPGRTVLTHFKSKLPARTLPVIDGKEFLPLIGQDSIDWAAIYQAAKKVGDTEWVVLEQEDYPYGLTPLQSVEKSLQGLKAIITSVNQGIASARNNSLNRSEQANGWKLLLLVAAGLPKS
jgi:sugar phosphate isomerase/epimerase